MKRRKLEIEKFDLVGRKVVKKIEIMGNSLRWKEELERYIKKKRDFICKVIFADYFVFCKRKFYIVSFKIIVCYNI